MSGGWSRLADEVDKFARAGSDRGTNTMTARAKFVVDPREKVKLPLAPLLRRCGVQVRGVGVNHDDGLKSFAEVVGVHVRTLTRWIEAGVSLDNADIVALRAGFHPCEVWGQAWWDACEEGEFAR